MRKAPFLIDEVGRERMGRKYHWGLRPGCVSQGLKQVLLMFQPSKLYQSADAADAVVVVVDVVVDVVVPWRLGTQF